jgi:hypothetical protein
VTLHSGSAPDQQNRHLCLFATSKFFALRDTRRYEHNFSHEGNLVGSIVGTYTDGVLFSGERAPFCGFDLTRDHWGPEIIDAMVRTVLNTYAEIRCKPPSWSGCEAAVQVALARAGFEVRGAELNYWLGLPTRVEEYVAGLKPEARRALKHTDGVFRSRVLARDDHKGWARAYHVLAANREAKGRPISLTLDYVLAIREAFPDLVRMVVTEDLFGIAAAALVYRVGVRRDMVQFWGDNPGVEGRSPMNVLARDVVGHCIDTGARTLDLGISTENGRPNGGLCQFKRSIGAKPEVRVVMAR